MEEVNSSTNDVGDSNNNTSTLDSNNAISAAATNGDREGKRDHSVSRKSKDKKVMKQCISTHILLISIFVFIA